MTGACELKMATNSYLLSALLMDSGLSPLPASGRAFNLKTAEVTFHICFHPLETQLREPQPTWKGHIKRTKVPHSSPS